MADETGGDSLREEGSDAYKLNPAATAGRLGAIGESLDEADRRGPADDMGSANVDTTDSYRVSNSARGTADRAAIIAIVKNAGAAWSLISRMRIE